MLRFAGSTSLARCTECADWRSGAYEYRAGLRSAGSRALAGGGPMTAVSWLDWKLGARLLLKYPALTIIGGLSLTAAIAIGAIGIELADELLYKRLPFDEGSRIVRFETQDTAASRVEPRVL